MYCSGSEWEQEGVLRGLFRASFSLPQEAAVMILRLLSVAFLNVHLKGQKVLASDRSLVTPQAGEVKEKKEAAKSSKKAEEKAKDATADAEKDMEALLVQLRLHVAVLLPPVGGTPLDPS